MTWTLRLRMPLCILPGGIMTLSALDLFTNGMKREYKETSRGGLAVNVVEC